MCNDVTPATDPDMLEVGRLANSTEDRSHFGAWAVSSSPLILGFDLADAAKMDRAWPIISNTEVLEVNQAWAGSPGVRLHASISYQVWAKPLGTGRHALFVISNASQPLDISVPLADVAREFSGGAAVQARDLYAHQDLGALSGSNVTVAGLLPHDSSFLVLSLKKGTLISKAALRES